MWFFLRQRLNINGEGVNLQILFENVLLYVEKHITKPLWIFGTLFQFSVYMSFSYFLLIFFIASPWCNNFDGAFGNSSFSSCFFHDRNRKGSDNMHLVTCERLRYLFWGAFTLPVKCLLSICFAFCIIWIFFIWPIYWSSYFFYILLFCSSCNQVW